MFLLFPKVVFTFYFSYFSSFWYIYTGLLFEHRRNREKMGYGRGSEVSVWSLLVRKSAVAADLPSLLGSEDLLPQPVAYSESWESARKLLVPTWLRCPRELGYFYALQGTKPSYTNAAAACQLVGVFVLFLLTHLKNKLIPKQVWTWFFECISQPVFNKQRSQDHLKHLTSLK